MKSLLLLVVLIFGISSYDPVYAEALAGSNSLVKLTPEISHVDVSHMRRTIRIQRNQNQQNRLENEYRLTSRSCPPFCIQAIALSPEIKTVGELELIDFLQQEVEQGQGLLLDVRMPNAYDFETIPGAVNIPLALLEADIQGVLPLFGVSHANNNWDYQHAKTLLVFCNGPWCEQSGRAIEMLLNLDYPATKLRYYRGGMQTWKILGLSTVSPQAFSNTLYQN